MARVIDSSVLIAIERRRQLAVDIDIIAAGEPLAIASVTVSELLAGAELARTHEQRQRIESNAEYLLERLPVLPFDLEAARIHARLYAVLRSAGQPIGYHDLQIAATALANGCDVVTLNVREFNRVPGLNVIDPGW